MHIKFTDPIPFDENIDAQKLENPKSLGKKTSRIKLHAINKRYYIAAEKVNTGFLGLIQKIRHLFRSNVTIEFHQTAYLVNKRSLLKRLDIKEAEYNGWSKEKQQIELQNHINDVLSMPRDINTASTANVVIAKESTTPPQPAVDSAVLAPQSAAEAQNRLAKAIIDIKNDIQTKKSNLSTTRDIGGDVSLALLKGNIGDPQILKDVGAVVNAANDTMYAEGGGTNKALTQAMGKSLWEENLKLWQKSTGRTKLEVSEAITFKKPIKTGTEQGTLLIQALGPNISNLKILDYEDEGQKVYQAYKNIFQECRQHGVKSVLLPILSASLFAGKYQNDPQWKATIQEAVIKAIAEEIMDPESKLKEFKIIDYSHYPFETTDNPMIIESI